MTRRGQLPRGARPARDDDQARVPACRRSAPARVLRREAPHTEALLRAVPFSGIADERRRLTRLPLDDAQPRARGPPGRARAQLPAHLPDARRSCRASRAAGTTSPAPRPSRASTASRSRRCPRCATTCATTSSGPSPRSRTTSKRSRARAGSATSRGCCSSSARASRSSALVHARWSASHPSGAIAWGAVVAVGVLVAILVGALQYFPRLGGADTAIAKLEPAFDEQRVIGLRAGTDFVVQAVRFGDPIMTAVRRRRGRGAQARDVHLRPGRPVGGRGAPPAARRGAADDGAVRGDPADERRGGGAAPRRGPVAQARRRRRPARAQAAQAHARPGAGAPRRRAGDDRLGRRSPAARASSASSSGRPSGRRRSSRTTSICDVVPIFETRREHVRQARHHVAARRASCRASSSASGSCWRSTARRCCSSPPARRGSDCG